MRREPLQQEGSIEKWVENQSAAPAEWSAKETNEAEEVSVVNPLGIDTTTEAFEPGGGGAKVTPSLGSETTPHRALRTGGT